jgi:hypothetical protein
MTKRGNKNKQNRNDTLKKTKTNSKSRFLKCVRGMLSHSRCRFGRSLESLFGGIYTPSPNLSPVTPMQA